MRRSEVHRQVRFVAVGGCGVGIRFRVPRMAGPGETVLSDDLAVINGGKAANQAIGAAHLGADASIISAVGADVFAQIVARVWSDHGVQDDGVITKPEASTMVGAVLVDAEGENRITLAPGALARITREDVGRRRDLIMAADVCVVSLEISLGAAAEALAIAREGGVLTILNPAPAPPAGALGDLLPLVDWVTPNESEARAMAGGPDGDDVAIASALLDRGTRGVVMTLGAAGALVVDAAGPRRVPSPAVPPDQLVDTAGAGDAFNAAFAVALAGGCDVNEAATFGCEAGSRICRGPGFVEALHAWKGLRVPTR